ncbi:unnamed protein product [Ixodes persulcatus]
MRTPNFLFKKKPPHYTNTTCKKITKKKTSLGRTEVAQCTSPRTPSRQYGAKSPHVLPTPKTTNATPFTKISNIHVHTNTHTHLAGNGQRNFGGEGGGDDVWYQSLGKWNGEGRLGQRTYCSRQQSENGLRLLPTVLTLQVTATTTAPGM